MAAIAVKVKVSKLIDALTAKIKGLKDAAKAEELAQKAYELAKKEWEKSVIASLVSLEPTEVSEGSLYGRGQDKYFQIDVIYKLKRTNKALLPPEAPERKVYGWKEQTDKDRIEEMENAIRLLQMTDEEYVNTSTYKSVSKYL